MKHHVYVTDVLDDVTEAVDTIPADENSIHNIDPFIQPLIDTDELSIPTEAKNEQLIDPDIKADSACSHQAHRPSVFSQNVRRYTGIFYALLASSLFTSSGFIIKQLRVDFFDALLCRFTVQTLILTVFIVYKRYAILVGSRNLILLQIIRALLALCGLLFFYVSYRYIPLPDLTTFRYTQVMWTALLAMIIFHERISIPMVVAIILTLVGVACVAQPTFLFDRHQQFAFVNETKSDVDYESNGSYRVLGLAFALICALSISSSIVLNKKLMVLKIPQSILMFHFSALTFLVLICNHLRNRFILHTYAHRPMFTWQFSVAASVSLLQLLSSTLTQKAIKLEHPSIVSVVQSSDILFALLLQNFIAEAKSNWLVFVGSALVTASIFLVGIHKLWKDRKALLLEDATEKNSKV
jgi:drug/metabolite transporter (DMT)-like permease